MERAGNEANHQREGEAAPPGRLTDAGRWKISSTASTRKKRFSLECAESMIRCSTGDG